MCCHVLGFSYPVLYLHVFKASMFFSPPDFCLVS
jgi:hypothetical protein